MDSFQNSRVKWPYATHLVDRSRAKGLLPMVEGHDPGALVLCRVLTAGKHKDLEAQGGRKMNIFPGDVFVGVLGDRYATDQFEGVGRVTGPKGHILGIGGVVGEVLSQNNRMPDPTTIEFLGRLADADGKPLYTQQFASLPLNLGRLPHDRFFGFFGGEFAKRFDRRQVLTELLQLRIK